MEKKEFNNEKQIKKVYTSQSLLEVVDNLETWYEKNKDYSKNVIVNINHFKGTNHELGQVGVWIDADELLLLADDIINNRFHTLSYGVPVDFKDKSKGEAKGKFVKLGGRMMNNQKNKKGTVKDYGLVASRFTLEFKKNEKEEYRYTLTIKATKGRKNDKGLIVGSSKQEDFIDEHSIQLTILEARKFFIYVKSYIETKIAFLGQNMGQAPNTQAKPEKTLKTFFGNQETQEEPPAPQTELTPDDDLFGLSNEDIFNIAAAEFEDGL